MADEVKMVDPPRKEDILYRDDLPDEQNNACVNTAARFDGHDTQIKGYRRGARLLVEHALRQQHDRDYLSYPILFLYRHHIELALKGFIRRLSTLLGHAPTQAEQDVLTQHRLDKLWEILKPMFAELCEGAKLAKPDLADDEGVSSYIYQLTELDRESFAFRYSHTKGGGPSIPTKVRRINLRHFAETIERLVVYLDGLDTAISVLENLQIDMLNEGKFVTFGSDSP